MPIWKSGSITSSPKSNLISRIPDTEREALIVARRGRVYSNSGSWRSKRDAESRASRIRSICEPAIASRGGIQDNEERLNGENGLLLTPTMDHLFDRGFISFEDSGVLIVSPVAHAPSLNRMGIATDRIINVGTFTGGQKQFLDYHRESVLLQARH